MHTDPASPLTARFLPQMHGMTRGLDDVTGAVIEAAIRLHRSLGSGLLESAYEPALVVLLRRRGLKVERQRVVGIEFEGIRLDKAFIVDLLVDDRVIVEIKSLATLNRAHFKQVLTYLRLMNLTVGLLLNFGAPSVLRVNSRSADMAPPAAQPPPAEGRVTVVEEGHRREPWLK